MLGSELLAAPPSTWGPRLRPSGVGALPSQRGLLAPGLSLCNSTFVCALWVTLDSVLGLARGKTETQSPTHMGSGADRPGRRPLKTPPPLLLKTFLPSDPLDRRTKEGPARQGPLSAGAGAFPTPTPGPTVIPAPASRQPEIPGAERARARPSAPEIGSCAHGSADSKGAPSPAPAAPGPVPRLQPSAPGLGSGGRWARGAVRGAAGAGRGGGRGEGCSQWPGCCAGLGGLGAGRTWQRAALGAHRRSGSGLVSGSAPAPLRLQRSCRRLHWARNPPVPSAQTAPA